MRGSSRSRKASPNMLVAYTTMVRHRPGANASHGPWNMKVRPDPDSIPPQVGVGGGTPRPRKERLDSTRVMETTQVVSRTMIGGMMFGRMCRHRMGFVEAPIDLTARTAIF